jgi:major membrane immunogen (membrane-anchored lipoprotein)
MMKRISLIVLSVAALTACGEKAQTLGTKNDATAYSGATNSFVAPGWTAGDKTSWEQHLRARGQYGMNDHSRAP